MLDDSLDRFAVAGDQGHLLTLDRIDVDGRAFSRSLRVATRNGANAESTAQVVAATGEAARAGDVLIARFAARCIASDIGEAQVAFAFNAADGADRQARLRVGLGPEWGEYVTAFRVDRDFAVGAARVAFYAGYDRQTIEIGGVSLENLGPDVDVATLPQTRLSYAGRSRDADWRATADARIERIRKGDLTIRVVDARGMPVAGARVDVALRRHAFGFGTCVDATLLTNASDDGARYREIVGSLFNRATFENDMKWPALYDGVPPVLEAAVAWLRERAIDVRGHALVWPSWRWLPKSLSTFRDQPDELRRRTAEHIARTASHFRGRLIQWDVVNEPFSEHDLIDALGGRDVIVDWFKLARDADPDARLFLNDYGIFDSGRGHNVHQDHFHDTLAFLQQRGAALDGVGIQSHFSSDLPSPEQLLATLDRFAEFGLPIESTELSLNLDDDALQADYLRDYLTILFSHERVGGVTLWGFWSGRHWRPQAGLWDKRWNAKPAAHALRSLLNDEWSTHAAIVTDASGVARVRGFCGQYDVTASAGGRVGSGRVELARDGTSASIALGAGEGAAWSR